MLSRIANSLYWMGRYVERADSLARFLRVQYFSMLDTPAPADKQHVLQSILSMFGNEGESGDPLVEEEVLDLVGASYDNPLSIRSYVQTFRSNAQELRHVLSTQLWEAVNGMYLETGKLDVAAFRTTGLYEFTTRVTDNCAKIAYFRDTTLLHDEVWQFVRLGTHLERMNQTLRILERKLVDVERLNRGEGSNIPLRRHQAAIALTMVEGLDMHRKLNNHQLTLETALSFLVTNRQFPRSAAYNAARTREMIQRLHGRPEKPGDLLYFANKAEHLFNYVTYPEIKAEHFAFVNRSLNVVGDLHERIQEEYFGIPRNDVKLSQTQVQSILG